MRVALVAALLAVSSPAFAEGEAKHEAPAAPAHVVALCKTPLKQFKANAPEDAKFVKATPGQLHFLQGIWVGSPDLPNSAPPGDGALIAQKTGAVAAGEAFFTRGAMVCGPAIPLPAAVIKYMQSLKTGAVDADDVEF